jgi:hypothetical protein
MLTKKTLKKWLNYSLLAITLACIVAALLMDRLSLGEKAVAVAGFLAALRAVLPEIKKQGVEAIDGLDIPDGSTVTQTTDVSTLTKTVTTVSPPAEPGAPTTSTETTPTTVPIRPGNRGSTNTHLLVVMALVGLAMCAVVLWALPARAQEFGGCSARRTLCAGPAVALTVGQFNLATSKFSGGVSPGVGFGATLYQDRWYAAGLAGYLAFSVGGGKPNRAAPALLFSFANYLRLGASMEITEQDVGVLKQISMVFGIGADFGGSPKYVRAAEAGGVQ